MLLQRVPLVGAIGGGVTEWRRTAFSGYMQVLHQWRVDNLQTYIEMQEVNR